MVETQISDGLKAYGAGTDLAAFPDQAGAYFVFLRDAGAILARLGYFHLRNVPLVTTSFGNLIYVGRAQSLRTRARNHFRGPSLTSSVRQTLGIVKAHELGLKPTTYVSEKFSFANEAPLSTWLVPRMTILYRIERDCDAAERAYLTTLTPPLNIQYQRPDGFARLLIKLKCDFVAQAIRAGKFGPVEKGSFLDLKEQSKRRYSAKLAQRGITACA